MEMAHKKYGKVTNEGGILTADDLKEYEVVVRDVVKTTYKGKRSERSSGQDVKVRCHRCCQDHIQRSDIDISTSSRRWTSNIIYNEHIGGAFKFGFAQQQELADPKFESSALNATSKMLETVNYWFGSKIMTDTGILLNNQMADFADPDNPETAK
ncbi:CD224 [Mytilus edulis]|uniref:GGT1_5 n=1 Tax=Mytilus edulis TaxID=6550 RepID=A0A8S3URF9_MYTED|nr:CD224 [Mytilus edulis]